MGKPLHVNVISGLPAKDTGNVVHERQSRQLERINGAIEVASGR